MDGKGTKKLTTNYYVYTVIGVQEGEDGEVEHEVLLETSNRHSLNKFFTSASFAEWPKFAIERRVENKTVEG